MGNLCTVASQQKKSTTLIFYRIYKYIMSDIAKKVKEKIIDVKDKAIGSEHADEREVSYTSSTKNDPTKEYESKEPMSPAKISEHEPTAVRSAASQSSC